MKIAVVGTGYVGLVAGTCFAETGNQVTCVDIDEAKVKMLREGESPIYEPGLSDMLKTNIRHNRLSFTTNLPEAVQAAEIIFLAVGTPSSEDGSADLRAVMNVAEAIGKSMNEPKIIVNKSTVPVGTAKKVSDAISANTNHKAYVVSNPEFLKEGTAIEDFLRPDRVVIGTDDDSAWEKMRALYTPFVRQGNPIVRMTNISAEITKYAANAMLATKISFMNEIARLCDKVGADVSSVRRGISTDQRIGRHFLYPGPGYGGSCFPKDVKALLRTGNEYDLNLLVVNATEEANAKQKRYLGEKIISHFGGDLNGKTIALWGLAFKPNTDDMREAPSLTLIPQLLEAGAQIQAFDPIAHKTATEALKEQGTSLDRYTTVDSSQAALNNADCLVLITEWKEFTNPQFDDVKSALKTPIIFDGRNYWDPAALKAKGFEYIGIGRS